MAFKIHINHELNFAYTKVTGTLSDEDLRLMVLAFQIESKGLEYVREIIDMRDLRSAAGLTVEGLLRMSELERVRSTDRDVLLAVLTSDRMIKMVAEIFANVNDGGNLRINVYGDDDEEALCWLGYEDTDRATLKRFIGRHTSRQRQSQRQSQRPV